MRSAQSTAGDGTHTRTGRGAGFAGFALALLVAACCLPSAALVAAVEDEVDGYHTFTNKDGQAIEAKIVQVASDWKNMTIERRDGRSFVMQINVLSLDDQQIVKDWIKLNPVASPVAGAELDVIFEKAENTIEREKDDYYRFTTKDVTYTITVRNKSRLDLVGAKLEYALLMTQGVKIYRDEISGKPETYSTSDDGEKLVAKGNEDLPATLPFNYAHNLVTKPVKSERVQGDGNTVYGEDEVVGALARVLDSGGNVIGEFKSAETGMRDITWAKDVGEGTGSSSDGASAAPSVSPSDSSSPTPPSTQTATIVVDGIDVRMLDEMPEKLQKGDTLDSSVSPKIAGKPFVVSANVDLDESSPDGVIVAQYSSLRL